MGVNDEKINKMHALAIKWRGEVLNEIVTLERVIDTYIAYTLCVGEEKRKSIMHNN